MERVIRSVSGIRGVLGTSLTPEVIVQYTKAFHLWAPAGKIAVGWDGRRGGEWIAHLVASFLQACGRTVSFLDVVPTPTVQLFVEKNSDVSGGIVVTASHNAAEWNGLKFLTSEGIFLTAAENATLWQRVDQNPVFQYPDWQGVGEREERTDAIALHLDTLLGIAALEPYIQKIQQKKFTVVVDAVNAAGREAVPLLLEKLGCSVIPLYCDHSGIFPHPPEPLPEHLQDLCQTVVRENADLGVAVDPDADRLVLVDEQGAAVWEEYTVVLAARAVLHCLQHDLHQYHPVIVVNLSTTQAIEDVAAAYGWSVVRSPVGEINVVQMMKKTQAPIGGEGSGGVIFPACHYGRDSLAGILLVLSLLADLDQSLSTLVQHLPKRTMRKMKIPLQQILDFDALVDRLCTVFTDHPTIDNRDGIRLQWADRWIHIRPSNTEPIVRIIAEAQTAAQLDALLQPVIQLQAQMDG